MGKFIIRKAEYQKRYDKDNENVICYVTQGGIMPIKYRLTEASEVEMLKDNPDGLNDVYRDIAYEIGVENTLAIYKLFHGTQISFPNTQSIEEIELTVKPVGGK